MRDRLIKLLENSPYLNTLYNCEWGESADWLLKHGVIVPPCKVGDTVYVITRVSNSIIELVVIGMWICEKSCAIITSSGSIIQDSFGKTVFLTKEEAENALQRKEDERK